jgi:hypothetical protein
MNNWTSMAAADHRQALRQAAEAHRQVVNRRRPHSPDSPVSPDSPDSTESPPEPVRRHPFRRWTHILALRW